MAIQAKRFDFFTENTNVPVGDFKILDNLGTLNGPFKDLTKLIPEVEGLLSGKSKGDLLKTAQEVLTGNSQLGRVAKDAYSSVSKAIGLDPGKAVSDFFSENMGDFSKALPQFRQLVDQGQSIIAGAVGTINGVKNTVTNSGITQILQKSGVDIDKYMGVLDKVTNVAGSITVTNRNSDSGIISGVAKYGYDLGLGGCWGTVSAKANDDHSTLLGAGSNVLSDISRKGNGDAVIEVLNSTMGSEIATATRGFLSKAIGNLTETTRTDKENFYDDLTGALNNASPGWSEKILNPTILNDSNGNFGRLSLENSRRIIPSLVDPSMAPDLTISDIHGLFLN